MNEISAPSSGRDRLIESLWQDAQREANLELNRAKEEAQRLGEENLHHKEREMDLASEKAHTEAMPHVSRILNRAHNKVRQIALEKRYAFFESCIDDVMNAVKRDTGFKKSVRDSLPQILRQVLADLDGLGELEIRLNPEDVQSAESVLREMELKPNMLSDEQISGGVLVTANNGSMIMDCTIEGRMGALRDAPPIDLLRLIDINDTRKNGSA